MNLDKKQVEVMVNIFDYAMASFWLSDEEYALFEKLKEEHEHGETDTISTGTQEGGV